MRHDIIGIVGAGVVGTATGIGLAESGHEVLFNDVDSRRLETLELDGFKVESSPLTLGKLATAIFVCVPTPTVAGRQDLSFLMEALSSLSNGLKENHNYPVLVIRSTVLPTTTRKFVIPFMEEASGLTSGTDFGVCVNPEFLREENAFEDFKMPSRILLGQLDNMSGDAIETIICRGGRPLIRCSLEEAEFVKYASNAFLSAKISFFNEMFLAGRRIGVNPKILAEACSLDPRIGPYGTMGGWAFSGKCLPKDAEALAGFIRTLGIEPRMVQASLDVNRSLNEVGTLKQYPQVKSDITT